MKPYLTVIILPMYNEEISIAVLREMFERELSLPAGYDYRIVIVNDGSNDNTLALTSSWARENTRVTVLAHTENRGVGQAIITGFGEAIRMNSHCVVTLDADSSHPVELITRLVKEIQQGADIAIASRFAPGGAQIGISWARRLYSWGARVVLSRVFPLKGVRDYTVGYRAYRTALVNQALLQRRGPFLAFRTFTASAEILLKMATLAGKIVEVPLVLRYDFKQSSSKLKLLPTLRDYARLLGMPRQECVLGRGIRV